jgi:hypothetical protein
MPILHTNTACPPMLHSRDVCLCLYAACPCCAYMVLIHTGCSSACQCFMTMSLPHYLPFMPNSVHNSELEIHCSDILDTQQIPVQF